MNPDIRLMSNPFPILIEEGGASVGVIAPMVIAPDGRIEDSVRRFPTLRSLAAKLSGYGDSRYAFIADDKTFAADWVAGMFMLFRSDSYKQVGGFDEGFFCITRTLISVPVCGKSAIGCLPAPGTGDS